MHEGGSNLVYLGDSLNQNQDFNMLIVIRHCRTCPMHPPHSIFQVVTRHADLLASSNNPVNHCPTRHVGVIVPMCRTQEEPPGSELNLSIRTLVEVGLLLPTGTY